MSKRRKGVRGVSAALTSPPFWDRGARRSRRALERVWAITELPKNSTNRSAGADVAPTRLRRTYPAAALVPGRLVGRGATLFSLEPVFTGGALGRGGLGKAGRLLGVDLTVNLVSLAPLLLIVGSI